MVAQHIEDQGQDMVTMPLGRDWPDIRDGVLYGDNLDVKHGDEYVEASADNIAKAEADAAGQCPESVDA